MPRRLPLFATRFTEPLARRPLALIGLGVVLYSTGPVLVAATAATGPVLSFWRLWIGAAVLAVAAGIQIRMSGRRPDGAGWALASACGAFFGCHLVLFTTAIKRTSVIDVGLMDLLAPVIVGMLAAVAFGERPGARFRLWSLVSIAGAGVVVLAGSAGPQGDPLGVALAVGNVVFFAVYFVGSKWARPRIDTAPFLFTTVLTAAVLVSVFLALMRAPVTDVGPADLAGAAAIAVVPGGLGHFVTTWPLHRVPANIPPIMQLAIPFLSGAMAWILLGQGIDTLAVLGGVVTLAGVAGALRSGIVPVPAADPDVVPAD